MPTYAKKKETNKRQLSEILKLGIWNVRALSNKEAELEQELDKAGIDIAAITETKKKLQGSSELQNYIMIYSGVPQKQRASAGVSIWIRKTLKNRIISYTFINERIITMRFKVDRGYVSVFALYAPEEGRTQDAIKFYEQLQTAINKINKNDYLLLLGDLNARVGNTPIKDIVGTEGEYTLNNNGKKLIEFATYNELRITNTFFKHRNIHKFTWTARGSASIIDYVLANNKTWINIKDVRVFRSFDVSSDHFLVRCHIMFPKRWKKTILKPKPEIETFKVHLLQDYSIRLLYQSRLNQKNLINPVSNNINEEWANIKEIITQAAAEAIGSRKKKFSKRGLRFWNDNIKQLIEEKKEAYLKTLSSSGNMNHRIEYKRKSALVKREVRKLKRESWKRYVSEIEHDLFGNQSKAYKIIKYLNNQERDKVQLNIISESKWLNYFKSLWTSEDEEEERGIKIDICNSIDLISMDELKTAINTTKNKKSPGTDNINMELIRYASNEFTQRLLNFINICWSTGYVPEEWNEALIYPLYKKGDKSECSNYRGISLLNSCYKIYAKIINQRLVPIVETQISETQHGFRKGRSCSDCIFVLTQLTEKRREFKLPTYYVFIDYVKAFDSLKRRLLWETLKNIGLPSHLITAIQSLYRNNKIMIRMLRNGTESAYINQGVRQGCPLSPTLFNIYMDVIIKKWLKTLNDVFKINNVEIPTLLFADDQLIIGKSEYEIQIAVHKLSQVANEYGMKISPSKTKVMAFKGLEPLRAKIVIYDQIIEQVNEFKYLGYHFNYIKSRDMEIKLNNFTYFCGTLQRTLHHNAQKETLLRFYKVIALPLLLYGSESWTLTSDQLRRIESAEMRFLRFVAGYSLLDHKKSVDIRKELNVEPVIDTIKKYRENWKGHVLRMPEHRISKTILQYVPKGKRSVGRPLKRWHEQF